MFWPASLTVADEFSFRPTFRFASREQRHRRCGERGEADADPGDAGVVAAKQRARRREDDVGDEYRVTARDQLLSLALSMFGGSACATEAPDNHERGQRFDQRVGPETDQRDASRNDPGSDRNPELDQVPRISCPGQQLCAPLPLRPLERRKNLEPRVRLKLDRAHRVASTPAGATSAASRTRPSIVSEYRAIFPSRRYSASPPFRSARR